MTSRPNIIVVITDQQRADTLGAYGCTLGATPHLDRIAEAGTVFGRGYCTNPLCMPSRASILTGRYPSATGVRTNGVAARPGQPMLAGLLNQGGYNTAAFGKIHYHPVRGPAGGYWPENIKLAGSTHDLTEPYLGFDTVALGCGHGDVMPGLHERGLQADHPEVYERRGAAGALERPDLGLMKADKIETYKSAIPVELYPTTWVTDRAVEYLGEAREPFFMWCGINDPHHPFNPPGEYWHRFSPEEMKISDPPEDELEDKPPHIRGYYEGRFRGLDTDGFVLGARDVLTPDRLRLITAAYYGMVSLIDDSVARIISAIEQRGLTERTVVVFVSDHGELLGDQGLILKGPLHFQGLLRVPFFWYGPSIIPQGRRNETPVSLIDLFPTLLDIAGLPAPPGTQGRSFAAELLGGFPPRPRDVLVEDDADALGLRLRTLITDRYRLTCYAGESYGELYDLEGDPGERRNLWDRDATTRRGLEERLLDLVLTTQERLPPKTSHA